MIELGWVPDVFKVFGGGAVGWLGHIVAQRSKERQMRHHLYREMLQNYDMLRAWLDDADQYMREIDSQVVIPCRATLYTDYYDRAEADLETFHFLAEAYAMRAFYRQVKTVREYTTYGQGFIGRAGFAAASALAATFEEGFVAGVWNLKLARRAHDPRTLPRFNARIERVRERGPLGR